MSPSNLVSELIEQSIPVNSTFMKAQRPESTLETYELTPEVGEDLTTYTPTNPYTHSTEMVHSSVAAVTIEASGTAAEDESVLRALSQDPSTLGPLHFLPDMSNPLHRPSLSPHNILNTSSIAREDVDKQGSASVLPSTARTNALKGLVIDISVRSVDVIERGRARSRLIDGHLATGSIVGIDERPHKRSHSSQSFVLDEEHADESRALGNTGRANKKRRRLLTESTPHVLLPHDTPLSSKAAKHRVSVSLTTHSHLYRPRMPPRVPAHKLISRTGYFDSNRNFIAGRNNSNHSRRSPPPLVRAPGAMQDDLCPSLESDLENIKTYVRKQVEHRYLGSRRGKITDEDLRWGLAQTRSTPVSLSKYLCSGNRIPKANHDDDTSFLVPNHWRVRIDPRDELWRPEIEDNEVALDSRARLIASTPVGDAHSEKPNDSLSALLPSNERKAA